MKQIVTALALVLALMAPAAANCLAQSQNAIAAVQIANAYSISRYTWAGDPWYDQVMPLCSKTAIREFSCNAAFNISLRWAEDTAQRDTNGRSGRFVCVANYLGAIAFGAYIRHAVYTQILHVRF
jgi:hypothetical protein